MERVVFLIKETDERTSCLLNPESVVVRRQTGIQGRRSLGGLVTGAELSDDPVLCTGGGRTELNLDLLFDTGLVGSSIDTEDVRQLTGPIWQLAENASHPKDYGKSRIARLVWGKSWNIPGIVTALAERLEYFTQAGIPRRSWIRMRMLRVVKSRMARESLHPAYALLSEMPKEQAAQAADYAQMHEVLDAGTTPLGVALSLGGERLDQLAYHYYSDASLWRLLARFNDIADPHRIRPGQSLQVPRLSDVGSAP